MPAKAGIQNYLKILDSAKASLRAPPFAGMTPKDVLRLFYETISIRLNIT